MTFPATVVVEIGDAPTPANWLDVSNRVIQSAGLRMRRGRSNQFETSSPGTLSFTLKADDGEFIPTVNGYMRAYGYDTIGNAVRVKQGGTQVFYGYIDSYKTSGDGGPGTTVQVTATDMFKRLSRMALKSYGVEESAALIDTYAATTGAVYALDQSKDGIGSEWGAWRNPAADPIRIYGGSAGSHEFTSEKAAPFLDGSIRILPWNQVGPVLEHPTTFNPGASGGGYNGTISFWFRTAFSGSDTVLFRMFRTSGGTGYVQVKIDSAAGALVFQCYGDSAGSISHTTSTVNYYDDVWHHVCIAFKDTSGTTMEITVDGGGSDYNAYTASPTSGGTRCSIGSTNRRAVFGGSRNAGWTDNTYVIEGYIACPLIMDGGSTGLDTKFYHSGKDGQSGDSIATRIDKVLAFAGGTTITVSNDSGMYLSGQQTGGRSVLDVLQEIADSDRGILYVNQVGTLCYRGSAARDTGASVVLTVSATQDLVADAFVISADDSRFANTVIATSPAGSTVQQDATSVAAVGVVAETVTLIAETLADMETIAADRLAVRLDSTGRLEQIKVDLLTTPNSIRSTVLQLIPLDRIHVTDLTNTVFGVSTYDGFVEGWELAISDREFSVTLDLSPVI